MQRTFPLRTTGRLLLLTTITAASAASAPLSAQTLLSENLNGGVPSNGAYANGTQIGGTIITPNYGSTYIINKSAGDNFMALSAGQYQTVTHGSKARLTPMYNLLAGYTYTISFDQAVSNLGSGPAAGKWEMFVNLGLGSMSFFGTGDMAWTARSFTYTPTQDVTNAVMNFIYSDAADAAPGSLGYNAAFIDNILVTAKAGTTTPPSTTVPEPATNALLASGLAVIAVIARKRKRA